MQHIINSFWRRLHAEPRGARHRRGAEHGHRAARAVTPSPEVTSRFTQGVDALKREGMTDEWHLLRLYGRALAAAQAGTGVNMITGLGAADQQAFASALHTIHTVEIWSPAIHRCFPADERKSIVDTLLALRRSGLPNDVIVGHVLPAKFEAPWVKGEAAREELRAQKQEEEDERQRQYRAALGIPVGPMPRGGGLMNAAAFGVGNLNI